MGVAGKKIRIWNKMKGAKYTLIISHSNAESIDMISEWLVEDLMPRVYVNAITYEYTGYNPEDTIQPNEQDVYDDIDSVYYYAINTLKINPENIILFGRSIGSGPTCYLAEKEKVAGIILHAPFLSIFRVIFQTFRFTLPFDIFPNIDRI